MKIREMDGARTACGREEKCIKKFDRNT